MTTGKQIIAKRRIFICHILKESVEENVSCNWASNYGRRITADHSDGYSRSENKSVRKTDRLRPDNPKMRLVECCLRFWLLLVAVQTVTSSCPAAGRNAGGCQTSPEDKLSDWSGSGQSGSGDNDGSAVATSVSGVRTQTNAAFESTVAANQTNAFTYGVDKNKLTSPDTGHWTSRLTKLNYFAENKFSDKERFRQFLNHTVGILLDIWLGKENIPLCNSSAELFTILPNGKWKNILEGAERLLEILHSCFPNSFVTISDCTGSTNNFTDNGSISREELEAVTLQKLSERRNNRIRDINAQLKVFQALTEDLEESFTLVQRVSQEHTTTNVTEQLPGCRLLDCQRKSLLTRLSALSSAIVEVLQIFSGLCDVALFLNELRSWKRSEATLQEKNNSTVQNSQEDAFHLLNLTVSSLDTSLSPWTCKDRRLCRDARRMIVYFDRLPFILPAKKVQLERLLALVCWNLSTIERSDVDGEPSDGSMICLVTDNSVCVNNLTLNCSEYFFIRTSHSHSSFSPEMFHHDYIIQNIGFSLIDRNWSKSARQSWCRLACTPPSFKENSLHRAKKVSFYASDALLLFFILFAFYLIFFDKRNLYRMTRNPRRTYLYLNLTAAFNQFIFHFGYYTPEEGYWCNSDGSVVIDAKDASTACKLEASIGVAASAVEAIVLVWVAAVWARTLIRLQKAYRVQDEVFCLGLAAHELVELAFVIMTTLLVIVISTVPFHADSLFHFQAEGIPAARLCFWMRYYDSPFLYGSKLLAQITVGLSFFLFSRTFRKLTLRRQQTCRNMFQAAHQSDTQAAILRKWLKRHNLFGAIQFIRSLVYCFAFFDIVTKKQSLTPKTSFQDYISCLQSFHCPESCHLLNLPSLDSPLVIFGSLFLTFLTYAEFSWIFFDEIEWNALAQLRPAFRMWPWLDFKTNNTTSSSKSTRSPATYCFSNDVSVWVAPASLPPPFHVDLPVSSRSKEK